ncbi:hypothetical protein BH20VER1_BH20VER1_02300 [soil metagenome]
MISAPSRNFQPQLAGLGAWTDHLHFGYDAVATLRPEVLVELGTDRGESYFAFCQAVRDHGTGTRCYAVDHWRGDLHVGGYDEATYRQVAAHNAAHYGAFSTLLRSDFASAAAQFPDESVDLLHLDGLHTEEAVRADLDRWLPKLRPGGILLLHDVLVRNRGFGVWRVWEELRERGRSYTFEVGPGLGVWEKPPAQRQSKLLETFLAAPNEESERLLADYSAATAAVHQRIAQSWANGSVRDSYFGQQTTVQIFYSADGAHREEHSVLARIGHGELKQLTLPLPPGGHRAVRIDFISAFTTVEIETIRLRASDGALLFKAETPAAFVTIRVGGDATRLPHARHLLIEVTGADPQLYLPLIEGDPASSTTLELSVQVTMPARL